VGLLLVASGLALVCLPGLVRSLGRRMAPAEWTRLCALTFVAGAVIVELAAALYGAPTVLRAAGVHALASACERMLGSLVPGGAAAGWAAFVVAVTMPMLSVIGVRRATKTCRSVHAEPWLGEHSSFGEHDLVVLPTDQLLAVSVAGPTSQIVVTAGLVEALSATELASVLRHEAAHLNRRHQRLLVLATAVEHAFGFLRPVRSSAAALRTAIERWADEEAAGDSAEARLALRAALLGVTTTAVAPSVAAFSAVETVVERVQALEAPPPRPTRLRRLALYLPGAALGLPVILALGAWAGSAHMVVAATPRCPL
jgi:Zn-dependent protease with chaperone function